MRLILILPMGWLTLYAYSHPSRVEKIPFERTTIDLTTLQSASLTQSYTGNTINTGNTSPKDRLAFAKYLIGIPDKYGSTDTRQGFDCAGFIIYVFNHFKISVPRSSVDFTTVYRQIELCETKVGDLILFTGTDSTIRVVGHMGIVSSDPGKKIECIRWTSGKASGVTMTALNAYYQGRFVKTMRIFKQNNTE